MIILSPISKYDEIDLLLSAGADEFYCGINFNFLNNSNIQTNCYANMGNSNFENILEFEKTVKYIHDKTKKIYLAINYPFFSDSKLEKLKQLINNFEHLNIDGFIVSDLGALLYLKKNIPNIKLHSSTLCGTFNENSVKLNIDLGIERVVLPDHMNIAEILDISLNVDSSKLEIFVLNNRCKFAEQYCSFEHIGAPENKKNRNINDFKQKLFQNIIPDYLKKIILNTKLIDYFIPYQHLTPCKFNFDIEYNGKYKSDIISEINKLKSSFCLYNSYLRMNRCGVCILFEAVKHGIQFFKIEGRFNPAQKKINDIFFLNKCRQNLSVAKNNKQYINLCRNEFYKIYRTKCNVKRCYYPEIWI